MAAEKKINIITYKKGGIPQYFEVPEKWMWPLLGVPSLLALGTLLVLLMVWPYLNNLRQKESKQIPEQLVQLKNDYDLAQNEIKELQLLNKDLQDKLAMGATLATRPPSPSEETNDQAPAPQKALSESPGNELSGLALFRSSMVMETNVPAFTMEDPQAIQNSKGVSFRFNIVNHSKDGAKLSGHIFVLMRDETSLHVYPSNAFGPDEAQLAFNKGEPFSTSKFRPVEAHFPRPSQGGKLLFKVMIFSRTGNLIKKQIFHQDVKI